MRRLNTGRTGTSIANSKLPRLAHVMLRPVRIGKYRLQSLVRGCEARMSKFAAQERKGKGETEARNSAQWYGQKTLTEEKGERLCWPRYLRRYSVPAHRPASTIVTR